MTKNALLELSVEELPSSYIEPARAQMASIAEGLLQSNRLSYKAIVTQATPRRLALIIEDLAEKSEDRIEEALGPAIKVGRDAQGNFTMAAKGFAARHSIDVEKLTIKKTDKGEYFCAVKKIPGEKSEKLLKDIFLQVITRLSFPKTMVWEPSLFKFARPLRAIIALYGEKIIKISIAGIKSAKCTGGLHTLTKKKITVSSAERYMTTMQNNCIIANPEERREVLKKIVDSTAKRAKGNVIPDEELLNEVNYLVEHPVAVLGSFDEKYLELPHEVLITCMRKKQKYFAMLDGQGHLMNHFVGIRNGVSEHQDIVREGYEKVLSARLSDAEFFFRQDTRTALAVKVEKLKGVLLHEKLGTVYDKAARVKELALFINNSLNAVPGFPLEKAVIEESAELSKVDLVTEMVFEYPELQGVMGRIYASKEGKPDSVAYAIEQHYWPLSAEGKLPETESALVLALADKLDTLACDFAIGLIPSGSADPYGLRRMGAGVVRILKEKKLRLPLRALIEKAFSILPAHLKDNKDASGKLADFLRQRIENIFTAEGCRFDEVRAVMASSSDDITDLACRLDALKSIRRQPDFEPLAGAFKRAANILKQAQKMQIAVPDTFNDGPTSEPAEKDLFESVRLMESEIKGLFDNRDYTSALQKMVGIKPKVDEFFNKIMVMDKDETVRANRLALLKYTTKLFFKILDFSLLQ